MKKENWIWMPHAGHLCVADDCNFHLNTYVGKFIVSTVGEYLPDSGVREIRAQSAGITLNGIGDARKYDFMRKHGWVEVGLGRKYETMVFKAKRSETNICCPFEVSNHSELDMQGYNESEDAYKGHLALCRKWSKK